MSVIEVEHLSKAYGSTVAVGILAGWTVASVLLARRMFRWE